MSQFLNRRDQKRASAIAAAARRLPEPTGAEWVQPHIRGPEFGVWVDTYVGWDGQYERARMLPDYEWEFEDGRKWAFTSVKFWRP